MTCNKCEKPLKDGAKFCEQCGAEAQTTTTNEAPVKTESPETKTGKISPLDYYKRVLNKYAVFTGRATRSEYWYFFLFNMLIVFGLGMLEGILDIAPNTDESVLGGIYQLAVLVPAVAVAIRRLHDTGHGGWWIIVPFANIIFLFMKSEERENEFGPVTQ